MYNFIKKMFLLIKKLIIVLSVFSSWVIVVGDSSGYESDAALRAIPFTTLSIYVWKCLNPSTLKK
jgi:hypothetical protein